MQRSPSNDENLTRFFDYVVFPSSTSLHLFLAVFENAYLFVLLDESLCSFSFIIFCKISAIIDEIRSKLCRFV